MGRRPSGALPAMRHHKPTNTARIVVDSKVHSLGRWGSPEAQDRYDTLMAAYLASRRQSLDAGLAVIGRPAAPATELPIPALRHQPRQHSLRTMIEGITFFDPWFYFGTRTGDDG
jgi:hypothetical protein